MAVACALQGQSTGKDEMLKELLGSAAWSVVTATSFAVDRTRVQKVTPVQGRSSVLSHSILGRYTTIRKRLAGNSTQPLVA